MIITDFIIQMLFVFCRILISLILILIFILEVELYDQYFDGDSEKLRLFIVHINDFKRSCELESGILRDMCRP